MTSTVASAFGDLLRRLRVVAGLTQEGLAERAGISVRGVSDLERGLIAFPRKETASLLADGLGLAGQERAAFLAAARRPSSPAPPRRSAETPQPVAASSAPVWLPARLPLAPAPLLGRQVEVERARDLVLRRGVRLLSITGPGGVGKTRLAIELARTFVAESNVEACYVELAPIRDAGLVASTIADVLGVREASERSLTEVLVEALGGSPRLLILDNFEHIAPAARLVAELLQSCPDLSVLVTSRAPLRLRFEQEFPIEPLRMPAEEDPDDLETLLGSPAVRLFVERAQAVRPDFAVTEQSAATIAAICRRLDGLPLAIELAAARVRLMPPAALLNRLERSLAVLTGGPIDLPARQQTLRDTVAWSYDLLDESARAVFRRVAVFAGSGGLESIAPVVDEPDPLILLDQLRVLVEQSLLRRVDFLLPEELTEPRFAMLETIREFGLEQLTERGEIDDVRRRHLQALASLVATAEPELAGSEQNRWLTRLDSERDNVRAALTTALEFGEDELGLAMATGLWRYREARGLLREGFVALERALAAAPRVSPPSRAKALNTLGNLANDLGDSARARSFYEEGLAIRREIGDTRSIAASLNNLGLLAMNQGDSDRAGPILEESLAIRRALGDEQSIAVALRNLGSLAQLEGRPEEARSLFAEALTLYERLGNSSGIAWMWWHLGEIAGQDGDDVAADDWLTRSLHLFRELDLRIGMAAAFGALADIALGRGRRQRAGRHFADALALWREIGEARSTEVLAGIAELAADEDRPERAVHLLAAADRLRQQSGTLLVGTARDRDDRLRSHLVARLGEAVYAAAWEYGRTESLVVILDRAREEAEFAADDSS